MLAPHLAALTFRADARALTRGEIALMLALHLAAGGGVAIPASTHLARCASARALAHAARAASVSRAARARGRNARAALFSLHRFARARDNRVVHPRAVTLPR